MTNYCIVRLGVDSEREILALDSRTQYGTDPIKLKISCRQVPKDVGRGDVAVIWLGTNNNKGGKTPWVQGIRALGKILSVVGGGEYSSSKIVSISIGVVLPASVTKMDIVTKQGAVYHEIAAMPVIGVNNYSSQVVQRIDASQQGQNVQALFDMLDLIAPGFKSECSRVYPGLVKDSYRTAQGQSESQETLSLLNNDGDREYLLDVDEYGLEKEESRDDEIEVPFDPTKIDIIARPMTISSLEDRLLNSELDLTPDFQRQANVWDTKRKSRLIESILLKIPLPSFYFSEDSDGGYAVVDGLQRLCAVFHFKNVELLNRATGAKLSPLRLKGLQYLKDLEDKVFTDLDRKFQRRIAELEITANIIRANTPSAVKFNVFARLNQNGMPLNAQEIRNAIFPGEWRVHLRHLAESEEFIVATDRKIPKNRQQDMELVLRFVALWQLGSPFERPPNQTLDEFLNTTVENVLSRWDSNDWHKVGKAFKHAIHATCLVRGRHAFRKSAGMSQRKPINRGLFESELIVFGSLRSSYLTRAVTRKDEFGREFEFALINNREFIQSLLYATGSAEASNARITVIREIVEDVVNAK